MRRGRKAALRAATRPKVAKKDELKLQGPIGPQVREAEIKFQLLGVIDQALRAGGTVEKSCEIVGLSRSRYYRWKDGRTLGEIELSDLVPRRPGPPPGAGVHRLREAESEQIKQAARADRYKDLRYRKLCYQMSRDQVVQVGEMSVYRVLKSEGLIAPVIPVLRKSGRPETDCAEGRKSALRAETRPEGR